MTQLTSKLAKPSYYSQKQNQKRNKQSQVVAYLKALGGNVVPRSTWCLPSIYSNMLTMTLNNYQKQIVCKFIHIDYIARRLVTPCSLFKQPAFTTSIFPWNHKWLKNKINGILRSLYDFSTILCTYLIQKIQMPKPSLFLCAWWLIVRRQCLAILCHAKWMTSKDLDGHWRTITKSTVKGRWIDNMTQPTSKTSYKMKNQFWRRLVKI